MAKKVVKLSASRIKTFLDCKQKYKFMYIDRLPKVLNPAFKLGLACHEALEFAGNIWIKKEKFTAADKKKILEKYTEVSVKEGISDHSIHEKGVELVKSRLKSFALGRKVVGLEIKFGMGKGSHKVVTEEGVPLIGAMDKLVEIDADTLLVVDYKTSAIVPTADDLKHDVQLSIYDLTASIIYPQYKRIILSLDMLKFDPVYTYRTIEERKEFSKYLTTIHKEMTAFTEKDAKPTLNIFCPWCEYREFCSEYEKTVKQSDYNFLKTVNMDPTEMFKEWRHVKNTMAILKGRERELTMLMQEKMREDEEQIDDGEKELYIRQNARSSFDPVAVAKCIPDYTTFATLVSNLNNKAVNKYAETNPALKAKLEEAKHTNYTAPFLAVKNLRKKKEN
jgi:RecB family exonuclease